jgi:hypothetical protein
MKIGQNEEVILFLVATYGVNTCRCASITASGAAVSSRGFSRSVGDGIARAGAAALESVVETDPVSSLVCEGLTLVIVGRGSSGNRGIQHHNTVISGGGAVG